MKYTKPERIEFGRKIHESGISNLKAAVLFDISEESARCYRILYERSVGLPHGGAANKESEDDRRELGNFYRIR